MPITINDISLSNVSDVLVDTYYAWLATGGFTVAKGFDQILKSDLSTNFVSKDVTNSLQLKMYASSLNAKLGAFSTDVSGTDTWANDSITISAADLKTDLAAINGANTAGIISVGKLSTLYTDFRDYVRAYFGYTGGFASLFTGDTTFDVNGGLFDAAAFKSLIAGSGTTATPDSANAAYTDELGGSITISNINQLLRYAVDADIFGNRSPTATSATPDAQDPNYANNYGMEDGFMPDDIIFVDAGFYVKLQVNVAEETYTTPINNPNTGSNTQGETGGYGGSVASSQETDLTTGNGDGTYDMITSFNRTKIVREVTVPLVIRLIQ